MNADGLTTLDITSFLPLRVKREFRIGIIYNFAVHYINLWVILVGDLLWNRLLYLLLWPKCFRSIRVFVAGINLRLARNGHIWHVRVVFLNDIFHDICLVQNLWSILRVNLRSISYVYLATLDFWTWRKWSQPSPLLLNLYNLEIIWVYFLWFLVILNRQLFFFSFTLPILLTD